MYPGTSEELALSIPAGFESLPKITVTVDGIETELEYVSGTVANQSNGNVRRTTSGLVVQHSLMTPRQVYDIVSQDSCIVKMWAGIRWRADLTERVPVFTGRPSRAAKREGDGTVTLDAADFGYDLAAQTIFPAVVQPASMKRRDAIVALVAAVFPDITITVTATDVGTLGSEQSWSGSRWDAINALCVDGKMEAFFLPDGSFLVRDLPVIGEPVYTFHTHRDDATVAVADRERPLDKLYNTVVFNATASDGSQSWQQEIRQVAETSSRAVSKIGPRVLSKDSVTLLTAAEAQAAAGALLDLVQGQTESISISAAGHPALECGDTVRLVLGAIGDEEPVTLIYMVDSIPSFDPMFWGMTLSVRNRTEDGS
jgi:hypothetical protein